MGDVVIPSDWDGESYCCFAVQWPESPHWRGVLNGLIDTAGTGFTYNEATGSVTDAINAIRPTWNYNFRNEVVLMTCSDEIANALLQIAANMSTNTGCGGCIPGLNGGTGGSGTTPQPPSTTTTDETAREGPPPPGFETWEEYDEFACNAAKYIIDQIIADLARLTLVTVATEIAWELAPILATVLLTPAPEVDLLIIAGIMIEAFLTALELSLVISHVEEFEDDYICSLLSGTDVDSSISAFDDKVDELVDDDTGRFPDPISAYTAKRLIQSFATIDSINRLYTASDISYPDYDCNCGSETVGYTVEFGDETSEHPSNPIVIDTEFVEGWGCSGDARELAIVFAAAVTITEITGDTGLGCGSCAGALIYHYFANTDYTSTITDGNGRPQDTSPVSGVRSMY